MSKPRHLGYILVRKDDKDILVYGRIFGRKNDADNVARSLHVRLGVESTVLEIHTRDHEGGER